MLQGRIWSHAEIRKKISPCGIILHNRPARCSTSVKQTYKHTSSCLHTGHFQSRMLDLVDSSFIHLASPYTLKMEGSLLSLRCVLCWAQGHVFRCRQFFVALSLCGRLKMVPKYIHTHTHMHMYTYLSVAFCKTCFRFPRLCFSFYTTSNSCVLRTSKYGSQIVEFFHHNAYICQSQVFLLSGLEVWCKGTWGRGEGQGQTFSSLFSFFFFF